MGAAPLCIPRVRSQAEAGALLQARTSKGSPHLDMVQVKVVVYGSTRLGGSPLGKAGCSSTLLSRWGSPGMARCLPLGRVPGQPCSLPFTPLLWCPCSPSHRLLQPGRVLLLGCPR